MYLLDSSAIITPFHRGQLEALSMALRHSSPEETRTWLEHWYELGFSSRNLVIAHEVYEEVVNRKRDRPEHTLLKRLWERGQITILEPNDEFYAVLCDVDNFVRRNYDPHQAKVFLKKADPILLALAKVYGATLVTEERHFLPERDGASRLIQGEPRLPFVAGVFGVKCLPLLTVLATKRWKWEPPIGASKAGKT
jgi:predicted nucleic acid-binding protein